MADISLETEVPLGPDGRFEATFRADLPAARRGWRIARNRVTWQGKTAEQCGVVITLPDNACAVAVVILPLESTARADGAQRLARSVQAARLTSVLRCLHQTPGEVHAVYYLGCTSGPGDSQQAELALATTTLGWPPGSFLLLPLVQDAPAVIVAGLDRLRWLFAGEMDLRILNLEPAFTEALTASVAPKEDRAVVQRLVGPGEDPETLFPNASSGPVRGPSVPIRPVARGVGAALPDRILSRHAGHDDAAHATTGGFELLLPAAGVSA